ncbi:MAG: YbaB/EbfC family nucleoid-associated protein [Chloroflexota bacterium]
MAKEKEARGGLGEMAAQVQRLQAQLVQAQAELAEETVEASAGGGAVRVVMSGTQECRSVTISPQLLCEEEAELLQDLVILAVNQAVQESRLLAARKLGPLSGPAAGATRNP